MEPLFPSGSKGDRQAPKWLGVGSSFPDLPTKRMQTSDFFVADVPSSATPPHKPKKKHKPHPSPVPVDPPSLSNYTEYEIIDRDGLTQVLKWRLDFGCKEQVQFGGLAGFEVPQYHRASNVAIGQRSKEADLMVKEMDVLLGGRPDLLGKKTTMRYYEAKWTVKSVDLVSGEGRKRDGPELFLERTRELNRTLAKEPGNVDAWISLVEIQEMSIAGKKAQNQITEKQISILEKALSSLQGLVTEGQLRKLLRKATAICRDDLSLSLWQYRDTYPASVVFWAYCMYSENCKFEHFTVTKMREKFVFALSELSERDENTFATVKVWMIGELAKYEEMVISTQTGYREVSTALIQSFLMRVFMYDEQSLTEVWDEEGPRIGEKSAHNSEVLTSNVQIPEIVTVQNWLQAETDCDNWLPIKASLQPQIAKCFPSAVVFSDDVQFAISSVPQSVSVEYKNAAVQLFLRHYNLQVACSDCQTDSQLLQWENIEESIDRRFHLKEQSQVKLQFVVNILGDVNERFPTRELQLWLVALEHRLGQQYWTKSVLSKSEDLAVWIEFAKHSEKAWNALRKKALLLNSESRLVFFYHSFQRLIGAGKTDLKEAVKELVLACGDEADALPALCTAKTAHFHHTANHTVFTGFSLSHIASAVALWLTYFREGLTTACDYFESTLTPDFPPCTETCNRLHDEWLCEQLATLLRYHQSHTHVYVKTDISERVSRLLCLFPRNPVFIRMYVPFCVDPLQGVRRLIVADEYHYAVLLPVLCQWQKDRILREIRSNGNFPERCSSLLALWEESLKGSEAENWALTGLRKMPFCKSLYLSAFSVSSRSEDVLAALHDKDLHLRFSPFPDR